MGIFQDRFINGKLNQAITIKIHGDTLTRNQVHLPGMGVYQSLIADGTTDKIDGTTCSCLQDTLVDHHATLSIDRYLEIIITCHEILRCDIKARGD